MQILIVCTGNTCRSPLAAAVLQKGFEREGIVEIEVTSAGTGALEGSPASEGTYLVGLEHGLDLSAHRARLLTRKLVEESDLILAMSRPHLARVRELGGAGRAHLIGEYAGMTGGHTEVPDPYGGELEEYRATLRTLEALAPAVIARATGAAPP